MLSNAPVNAALPAKDIDRAKKFYQDTLGLQIKSEDEGGIVFKSQGDTCVLVYPSSFAGTNQATAAGWSVSDLEAEMTDLGKKGVTFEDYDLPGLKTEKGIATFSTEKAAWFKDTEGNILVLSQRI
jgi:predicted enzyme related to lactoylglutathione lyase